MDYSQGEERVFVVVSRSGDLPKGHRMAVSRDYCCTVYNQGGVRRLTHIQPYKTNKGGRQPFFAPMCANQGFGQSELHLPFDQNCQLSSKQLFAVLVQFGRYVSYGLGPRQLRRTQAVVAPGSCRPFHAPLVSWFKNKHSMYENSIEDRNVPKLCSCQKCLRGPIAVCIWRSIDTVSVSHVGGEAYGAFTG